MLACVDTSGIPPRGQSTLSQAISIPQGMHLSPLARGQRGLSPASPGFRNYGVVQTLAYVDPSVNAETLSFPMTPSIGTNLLAEPRPKGAVDRSCDNVPAKSQTESSRHARDSKSEEPRHRKVRAGPPATGMPATRVRSAIRLAVIFALSSNVVGAWSRSPAEFASAMIPPSRGVNRAQTSNRPCQTLAIRLLRPE
jgi:hypothetical protein